MVSINYQYISLLLVILFDQFFNPQFVSHFNHCGYGVHVFVCIVCVCMNMCMYFFFAHLLFSIQNVISSHDRGHIHDHGHVHDYDRDHDTNQYK